MTPAERDVRYAPESIANAPMMRPSRRPDAFDPCNPPVLFAARFLGGLGVPGSLDGTRLHRMAGATLPWIYDPIGGDG